MDMDSQGHLSQYFGVEADDGNSTLALLTGEHESFYPDFITQTGEHNIDIVPANIDLARADLMGSCVKIQAVNDLRIAIEEDDAYDFCIMDCHPGFGRATQAALLAADEVLIPVRLDLFSTSGMADLIGQVRDMRKLNSRLRVAGVLATQYMATDEEREAHRYLTEQSGLPVFWTKIRMSRPVFRSVAQHESLFITSPKCGAARDYRKFCREYLEGRAQ